MNSAFLLAPTCVSILNLPIGSMESQSFDIIPLNFLNQPEVGIPVPRLSLGQLEKQKLVFIFIEQDHVCSKGHKRIELLKLVFIREEVISSLHLV